MKVLDNINTLWGDDLRKTLQEGSTLQIASSCFSIYAYEALKDELQKLEKFEFIFTEPLFLAANSADTNRERREFHIPKKHRERFLCGTEFEIQLKNRLTQRAIARECADWIRKKATFRSKFTNSLMQQFACVDSEKGSVSYAPLNGFTVVDLGYQSGDAVSNLITRIDDTEYSRKYLMTFDRIWRDESHLKDVTEEICSYIESVYRENSPEKIYFFMLYNIFTEFLEDLIEDLLPNDLTGYKESVIWERLFNFQRDAATGLINKLEKYNGCILADSVGLGKTFTALAVIKYYELRNRSVLVLCPKKLADNWLNFNRNLKTNILQKDKLNYDVLCHTDLQRTSGESFGTPLNKVNWGNYDLVVIDESHNFRNNLAYKDRETRYQRLMNAVIREGVKTKLLMLSATPVNNRFSDLRNQLALAYEGESENLSSKLRIDKPVEEVFRRAQTVFNLWSRQVPEKRTARAILDALDFDFFELLDSVTIARSRKHIETFYDTSDIGKFPERLKPISFRCPLTDRPDVVSFNEIFNQLSALKLSIYAPISYIHPSRLSKYEELYDTAVEGGRGKLKQADRERSLQSLMTTNLLKRLESSVYAFRLTLNSLKEKHDTALRQIRKFSKISCDYTFYDITDSFSEIDEDDEIKDFMTGGKVQVDLSDMDLISWERDLKDDLQVISSLLGEMSKVTMEHDSKLQHIRNHIRHKSVNHINPGNRKVLVFTAFADTAEYLYSILSQEMIELGIHSAKVTGGDSPKTTLGKGYDFQSVLTLFSPLAKEKHLTMPDETKEIDLLIGTDCISEGQNLQDCDYLINYDIHWNPVRIIQRFGRIDRIGSKNDTVQLVNYWPDISLDEYINLKERVENRMVIADVSATGDDNVLTAKANDVSYRREQLQKLQEEVIEIEELKTGINITDLGLNDFRMDLLSYMKVNADLDLLPNGLHAIVPANKELGLLPGVIFTLRNRNSGVNISHHNRLHPYYLIYISEQGEVIMNHTQVKNLLDLARAGCRGLGEPVKELCKAFNRETDDGNEMTRYSNLLDEAIRSMIEVKEQKDIDSLFSGVETTALEYSITGLDDFELVSFLVIKEGKV